ncbi:MAG: tetratricopeptide repeat protein [Pseudomonadota bacterium]
MNVTCPACQNTLEIDADEYAGQEVRVRCPVCGESFFVPLGISDPTESTAVRRGNRAAPLRKPDRSPSPPTRGRFFLYGGAILVAALLAVLVFPTLSSRFFPGIPVVRPIVGTTPRPTATPLPLAPTATAVHVVPFPTFPPTIEPVSQKPSLDLGPLRAEISTFAPTPLRKVRLILADAMRGNDSPPHDLQVLTAQVYAALGDRERNKPWITYAYELAYRARSRIPDDPEALKALFLSLVAARKYSELLPEAAQSAKHSTDPVIRFTLGSAQLGTGRAAEGRKTLEELHRRNPTFFPAGEALAAAYLAGGRASDAELLTRRLAGIEPNDPMLTRRLATALEAQKRWKEAMLYYEPLADLDPADWNLRFSLGHAARMAGQLDAARTHFDSLISRTDLTLSVLDRGEIYLERGRVEFDAGKPFEAVPFVDRALQLRPNDLPTVLYLAGALYKAEKYPEAAQRYADALALDPKNIETERYLGMSLLESGDYEQATKRLQSVVRRGAEDASLDYLLGRAREGIGDREGAISYLERALLKDPNHRNARVRLEKLLNRSTP